MNKLHFGAVKKQRSSTGELGLNSKVRPFLTEASLQSAGSWALCDAPQRSRRVAEVCSVGSRECVFLSGLAGLRCAGAKFGNGRQAKRAGSQRVDALNLAWPSHQNLTVSWQALFSPDVASAPLSASATIRRVWCRAPTGMRGAPSRPTTRIAQGSPSRFAVRCPLKI